MDYELYFCIGIQQITDKGFIKIYLDLLQMQRGYDRT